MIYVIAAYTITFCALSLYAVLLQHRRRVFAADRDAGINTASGPPGGFNVGAALWSPIWMWSHGMRFPGVALLLLWFATIALYGPDTRLPFLFVAMIPLAAGIALGFVGNRIAVGHRGTESLAEFSTSQLPWATSGVALYTLFLPWIWYFLYAAA